MDDRWISSRIHLMLSPVLIDTLHCRLLLSFRAVTPVKRPSSSAVCIPFTFLNISSALVKTFDDMIANWSRHVQRNRHFEILNFNVDFVRLKRETIMASIYEYYRLLLLLQTKNDPLDSPFLNALQLPPLLYTKLIIAFTFFRPRRRYQG